VVDGAGETVAFRLWPPVAIGAPLVAGWLATLLRGDPVDLGGWRVPLGWLLVLLFAGWNGWSLWLFGRHRTGLLPGQATHAMIEQGPYRLSRNPLYVGLLALYLGLALLAPTFWGLVLFPAAVLLVRSGAIRPEERFLRERFGARYDDYTRRVRRFPGSRDLLMDTAGNTVSAIDPFSQPLRGRRREAASWSLSRSGPGVEV